MSILRFPKLLSFSIALLCAYFFANGIKASPPHWSVGVITNGMNASGADVDSYEHRISIIIHFAPPNTNIGISPFMHLVKQTNDIRSVITPLKDGRYFLATNSFCGFMELHDADGHKVRLLKPEVNNPEAYPNSYRLSLVGRLDDNPIAPHEIPYALSGADANLSFYIKDYFKIKESGEYQLTVWPKIYRRSATNHDLCERIDLPPVTIPIKWTGNSQQH